MGKKMSWIISDDVISLASKRMMYSVWRKKQFECGRVIYWFFDKKAGFKQFLVRGSLEGY